MRFLWGEHKRLSNLDKHQLDFEDVFDFDWETAAITPAVSGRFKAVGYFRDGAAVVVYALLGAEGVSIISFRPAKRKERKVLDGQ